MTFTDVTLPPAAEPETAEAETAAAGTADRPRPGRRLAAAVRSERIKATTVRTNVVLLACAAVVGLVSSWAIATFVTDDTLTVVRVFVFPTLFTAVLATVGGILVVTSDVQHGTLAGSFTAHPARWPVVVAKIVVAAGLGLVLGAVGVATGFVGALAGGIEVGDTSGVASTVLWALLYTVGSALLGLGVGMAVRHSAAAVSGVLVWWLVVESLIVQFAPPEAVRFVPFDTGFRTLGIETDFDVPEVVAAGLPNVVHASIFWGYVIAAVVVGTAVLLRRDAD